MGVVTPPEGSSIGPQYCRGLQGFKRRQNIYTANCEAVIWWRDSPTLFPLLHVYTVSDAPGRGCQWWLPGNREKPLSGASH